MLARGSLWASSQRSPEGAVIRLSSTVVIVSVKRIPVSGGSVSKHSEGREQVDKRGNYDNSFPSYVSSLIDDDMTQVSQLKGRF